MRKLKLLFAACALLMGAGQTWAQMTDVTTTYITNPGFETDVAATDLTGQTTQNTPTGWTIFPSSLSNTQWGTASSSTKIQGNSTSQDPSEGDNYFYFRDNWQSGTNISVSQNSKSEVPAGNYVIYIDVFTYSSNGTQPVYSFTVKDGSNTYVNGSITANGKAWVTYYYHFKLENAATLTFSANMSPKSAASGKHDWMLLDNIKLLKAGNPAAPISNNTTDLYLYNEATSQFLSAGQSWGTHAIVDNYGQEVTATLNNGVYTLKTQQYNAAYLGNNLYMDNGTAANWLFLETEANSGKYYMTYDGVNFMTSNGAGAEVKDETTPNSASVWSIVSKADRKAALSSATVANPANATFLIADANFNRNAISSVWNGNSKTSNNATNLNLAGGNNENMCAESYHATFSINQTLTGLRAGVYGLTAQGFYRQDGSDNEHLPYFYLGEETVTFPEKTGSENSMAGASTSFSAGLYTTDPIYLRVEENGSIELGAKLEGENYNLWCIWDNFQLTYYGDVTVAEVRLAAFVDAYNSALNEAKAFTEESMDADDWTSLREAITANTLDLNDSELTEAQLTTATANLAAANEAATIAVRKQTTYSTAVSIINGGQNVDLTSLIINAGFEEGNTNGWSNDGTITANAQSNSSFDNKKGTNYCERWHASGTIDINQTVANLPVGLYRIDAYMYSDTQDAKLYANTEEVSVTTSRKYSVVVDIADKGSIKIGASCTLTTSTWICMDDFKLTYLAASYANLPYTLASGKMGTDKADAQTAAENTFTTTPNKENYDALIAAISEAEASIANYNALKSAIDKAEEVKAANNFVTAEAATALENEITTATTAWTNVTYTDAQATAEIAKLGSTVSAWRGIGIEGKAGAFMASAWGKTSENWWEAPYINTWSTEGDNDGSGFSVPFFEYYTDNNKNLEANTFTANLTGLENGCYEVELWARVQRRSDADFNSDNSMITMSVNGGEAVSIMSNTENNVGSGTSVMRLGRYTARGIVTDGTLTLSIDVKLGSNVHWLSWRDVKYTKVLYTINETADWDNTTEGAGDVTLNRTIKANVNTLVLPFSMTQDEVEETFGTGSKVYVLKSYNAKTDNLSFTTNQGIVANKPCLLKATAAGTSYTIEGRTIVAGEPKDEVTGASMIGTYAASILAPTDSYIFSGGNYYIVDSEVTLKNTRAYIQLNETPAEGARTLTVSFDGGETTGIATLENGELKVETGVIYDLSGRVVKNPAKGIYVINGKKVVK